MVEVLRSWVVGPLELYARGFAAELARQGYTVDAAVHQLGLVAHLSRWMASRRLDVADLTPAVVERYVVGPPTPAEALRRMNIETQPAA